MANPQQTSITPQFVTLKERFDPLLIFTKCQECNFKLAIVGKAEEFRILEDPKWASGFPCVLCPGIALRSSAGAVHRELTVGAYFRALHGLGVGDTAPADPERVKALFEGDEIVGMELRPIGQPTRTLLQSLTFKSGTTMHFASSNEGACIYLIEEAASEDYRLAADPDSQRGPTDRAQDGPPSDDGEVQSDGLHDVHAENGDACDGPRERKAGAV